jgi:hypothetical protein
LSEDRAKRWKEKETKECIGLRASKRKRGKRVYWAESNEEKGEKICYH